MASINGLQSTNSNLYGSKNVISGLASGMDTESLIENSVAGYKTKISSIKQKQDMISWKQEAYRSIAATATKLVDYASFSSNKNLTSKSLFINSSLAPVGANSSLVDVKGKSRNDVTVNLVSQLAAAATGFGRADVTRSIGDLTGENDWPQELVINGVSIGKYTSDVTLQKVIDDINASSIGVKVSYSDLLEGLTFKTEQTGAEAAINFEGFAASLFSFVDVKQGQNAKLNVTVNGQVQDIESPSNTLNMDGAELTLKGTFNGSVSFIQNRNTDNLINAVKSFIEDYNATIKSTRSAYRTQPLSLSGSSYQPLTEKDKEDMSETAIKNYEEKAKTGILYNDSDLAQFYNKLNKALGNIDKEKIGIKTIYDNGAITLSLDEEQFNQALSQNTDRVQALVSTVAANVSKVVENYTSTNYSNPGILTKKAGNEKSATSLISNSLQQQYDKYTKEIESWETKLSNKVDYYTKQFTNLEKLINTMNGQSGMLAGLMGYQA